MEDLAREVLGALREETLVTDAGSVKARVVEVMEPLLGGRFVGAHPMAGSEQSGLESAGADLFEGATCVLTPTAKTDTNALAGISDFWTSVGCRNIVVSAGEHDRLVARSSHLPHAVASVLAKTVESALPAALAVTGSGFRDTTRVAAGPPGMWAEIFLENRQEVLASLNELKGEMQVFAHLLETGNRDGLEKFLLQARDVRKDLE
jgi:prephenate dehydrogenase